MNNNVKWQLSIDDSSSDGFTPQIKNELVRAVQINQTSPIEYYKIHVNLKNSK